METGKNILVIDDEAIVRMSCTRTLGPKGYNIDTAEHCVEGLHRLKQKRYDLVLTDFKMPHMDGLELAAHIAAKHPETKIILFTGYSTEETALSAVQQGVYYYMEKPFTPEDLIAVVQKALAS
jgi:DNA-binding NtrC family response regulator